MFSYTIKADSNVTPTILADTKYAIDQWSNLIDGKGTLVIDLNITSTKEGRAETIVPETAVGKYQNTTMTAAAYELRNGVHLSTTSDDAVINIDPNYLQNYLYVNTNPNDFTAFPDRNDLISVIVHEMGHVLGFDSYHLVSDTTDLPSGSIRTMLDNMSSFVNGVPMFSGTNAEAVNGGNPIPITHFAASDPQSSQNFTHIGNDYNGPFGHDVMAGTYFRTGFQYGVSKLDAAIIEDVTGLTAATPTTNFICVDQTTGQQHFMDGDVYHGPVAGIKNSIVAVTGDSLNITAMSSNVFIHSGSGDDAIDVSHAGGNNIMDGSTGSNFLVGGKGYDTFFVDDRDTYSDTWSTLVNFHTGDACTMWGLTPNDFAISMWDNQGAAGYTGLTLTATAPRHGAASITIAGFSKADLADGKLTISYGASQAVGNLPGSSYLQIVANG